jgi:hypothetical protein
MQSHKALIWCIAGGLTAVLGLPTQLSSQISAADTLDVRRQWVGSAGFTFLGVQKLGVYGAFGPGYSTVDTHFGRGLAVELGLGAVSVGIATFGYGPCACGLSVRASVVRSWNAPALVEANQWFLELAAQVVIFDIGPRLSVMKRVRGEAPGDGFVLAAGIVLGT